MKKMYMLEDLDCANCAAKMEEAISKIDGVTYARVSYLAQKLTLEADDARYGRSGKALQARGTRLPHPAQVIFSAITGERGLPK